MSAPTSLIHTFENTVLGGDFPCIGAKAAQHKHQIEYLCAGDMRCPADDAAICSGLQNFAAAHDPQSLFVSYVVIFDGPRDLDEHRFENTLWARLSSLHAIDRPDFKWDPSVSADPASPHFSMSIGGRAFYVVGLHPNATRASRRFERPALVFNLHSQFEALRAQGRYDSIRDATRERDAALCGSPNPTLSTFGERSEARQYSGRATDAAWTCPFGKPAP